MRYRAKHTPGRGQEYLCVQRSGESRNFASHTAYRGLLRPSSVRESSHPSLKVFDLYCIAYEMLEQRVLELLFINRNDPSAGSPTDLSLIHI